MGRSIHAVPYRVVIRSPTTKAAVQVCTAIHQKGFEVIAEMNEYIDRWAERQGFGSLDEFRGRLNFKNDTSAMFQRVQYMKYFPSEAK